MPRLSKTPPAARPPLQVIAHRGDKRHCPENTMAAFKAALRCPINGIELDLRLSKDSVPVVCHDGTLKRFGGSGTALSAQTVTALKAQDIGTWFARRFAGERIVTLSELLKAVGKRTTLFLEIKAMTSRSGLAVTRRLCRAVAAELKRTKMATRVLILCFDEGVLRTMRRLDARLRCVRNVDRLPRRAEAWLERQRRLGFFAVDCNQRRLGKRAQKCVDAAHARGLRVFTYTCNDLAAVRRALDAGVDGVLGDDPAWLARAVKRLSK
jgi:glycerophosphoryl diester phosphodiesterase